MTAMSYNGNCPRKSPDNAITGSTAQKANDRKDMAVLTLGKMHPASRPAGTIRLTREGAVDGVVRLFQAGNDRPYWKSDEGPKDVGVLAADTKLLVEGVTPGRVVLRLQYTSKDGQLIWYDKVRIGVVTRARVVAAGDFIVPKSNSNAIRYAWDDARRPSSVQLVVRDRTGNVVRTMAGLPTSYAGGQPYAEHKWNGCRDRGGTQPLTEALSPYTLTLAIKWAARRQLVEITPRVEAWIMGIDIADMPKRRETLVSGPDERSVRPNTLEVKVSLDGNPEETPSFTVTPNTSTSGGPSGNQRGCRVSPSYTFYTTPKTPYDIRYEVIIQQKTKISGLTKHGLKLDTVVDGTLNPWDMDPARSGRQTKGTWKFGIDASGTPRTAKRRDLQEVYE